MELINCFQNSKRHSDAAIIDGGKTVAGKVKVSGFKISAIPIITATILTSHEIELINVPDLEDVRVLLHLIELMGGEVKKTQEGISICNASLRPGESLPADIITSVHGTIYLLPALLARFGYVHVVRTKGGCDIGERPIEHIVKVMQRMGAHVVINNDEIIAEADSLSGAELTAQFSETWDKYRSGATKTALLLGVMASGETIVNDAYRRASILEFVAFLRSLGANITGEGTSQLIIKGNAPLHGSRFRLEGDYLEALTYLSLLGCCKGEIEIKGFDRNHCRAELDLLQEMGINVKEFDDGVLATASDTLRAVSFDTITVDTDIQPLLATVLTTAKGQSIVEEKVWENRFGYASQLNRMGAITRVNKNVLTIDGVKALYGATVYASELRGAAALIIASAAAKGVSKVEGLSHLIRGYNDFIPSLQKLGVNARFA